MAPTLFAVTVIVFLMTRLIPGDPARAIVGDLASPELVAHTRAKFGLDRPLPIQYAIFVSNLARGDLGISIRSRRPVTTELLERLPNTVKLAVASLVIGSSIGIFAGIISATKRHSIFDNISMVAALLGVSMPAFWQGLMLLLVFSVILGWLPAGGSGTFAHLILPAVTLGTGLAAITARLTRSSMLDVLYQDFITTARAKGLREKLVVYKHALRNALIPVVTIMGLQLGALMGGAVITETVFAWPGVGRLLIDAISGRDHPMVQGAVLMFAIIILTINLVVDLLYTVIDPRIRYA